MFLEAAEQNANPLIPDVAELVVGVLAFLVVFGLLARFLLPNIQKALEARTDAIEGGIARAEEAQAEAQRTLEQYRSQLAEARHEAAQLREQAREQGSAILAEMREQAQAESRRIVDAAHQQIDADRKQAFASLRQDVGSLATDLASRIVGEALQDRERIQRTIDRFLGELEETAAQAEVAPAAGSAAAAAETASPAGSDQAAP
jgi:F-type H+-transporting ATPase subunit b